LSVCRARSGLLLLLVLLLPGPRVCVPLKPLVLLCGGGGDLLLLLLLLRCEKLSSARPCMELQVSPWRPAPSAARSMGW